MRSAPWDPASIQPVTPSLSSSVTDPPSNGRVRMDVDQAGHDQLAACVDHLGSGAGDSGAHGGNAAAGNRDVTDRIEARRGSMTRPPVMSTS
jgi:hypothetical protein